MGWQQALSQQTTTCPQIKSSVTAGLPKLLSIKRTQNQKMHASVKPKVQNTGPIPAPMNATEGWQWAGAYPYQNLDDTVGVLLQCVKNYMIGNCMQKALDTFQCSA